jgi:hypothetical protein
VTIAAWLRERTPSPPPRLSARIAEVLGDGLQAPSTELAARCLEAAETLLQDLLGRPSAGRESALDLLTVDALVTYAFDAASDAPSTMAPLAGDAARRFAAAVPA